MVKNNKYTMILYIEKQAKDYKQMKHIIGKFSNAEIMWIDNYKNIFDKKIGDFNVEKCIIVAKLNSPSVTDAPKGYGHNNDSSFFFKTSLNCVYDCDYCFLKGAFKNDMQVYFVNYDEIKQQIKDKIKEVGVISCSNKIQNEDGGDYELKIKSDYKNAIWFYSSDYSDILGMDYLSGFMQEFVQFFEDLNCSPFPFSKKERIQDRNGEINEAKIMMEIRTKSGNIKPILDLGFVPKNTEFAFSLNPQSLIEKYEKGTANLDARIEAINCLLNKGFKVGIRFLPLLPVKNYKEIYSNFVDDISKKIDFNKVSSNFASGLLYTRSDYNVMLKKYPRLDVLYRLKQEKDGFVREEREVRNFFYNLFRELDGECFICLDEK